MPLINRIKKHRKYLARCLPPLVLIIVGLAYCHDLDSMAHFHIDEAAWIFSGKMYTDLFFYHHDLDNPLWDESFGTWGNYNPPVGKYIIGLSLNTFGQLDPFQLSEKAKQTAAVSDSELREKLIRYTFYWVCKRLGVSQAYNYSNELQWNIKEGRIPDSHILSSARLGIVGCSLIAGLFLYLLARHIFDLRTAWITLGLYFCNPMIYLFSRRATTDIPCLMFVIIGIYGLVKSLEANGHNSWKGWIYPIITGLAWGLAISTKLSALAPWGVTIGLALLLVLVRLRKIKSSGRAIYLLAMLMILPPIIFIATNPFLHDDLLLPYGDQPNKLVYMYSLGEVVRAYDHPDKLINFPERAASTVNFLFTKASLSHAVFNVGLGVFIFLTGLFWMGRNIFKKVVFCKLSRGRWSFLMISTGTWLATTIWLPFSWDRFYIPLLPFYLIVMAYWISNIWGWLISKLLVGHIRQ